MLEYIAYAHECQQMAQAQFEYCIDEQNNMTKLPEQVEERGCGDCDDLALWKYECMISYGVPETHMLIAIYPVEGGYHAVLDVAAEGPDYRLDVYGAPYRMGPEHPLPTHFINPADRHIWQINYGE